MTVISAARFIGVTAALLLSRAGALAVETYLDNGVIKIGVELTKGGSITYLSASGTTNNQINDHDLGRQIQQSYYSGPQPYNPSNNINPGWTNWPWNPIQTGDSYNHPSQLLSYTNDGRVLYVKCRPMQWALNNVPGECTFESWITLTNNVAIVSNRLVNARTDTTQQFSAYDQELPAVYTIGKLYRLFSYVGAAPFSGASIANLPTVGPPTWSQWSATESWAALLDTNNWGVGVYHPGRINFIGGFNGTTNIGGPYDDPCGYIAPFTRDVLDSNIEYTYTYHIILGTLQQIRDWVYAQPYRPGCNFVFQSDRQHWFYAQTTDAGWPITNHLHVSLNSSDPQMSSPKTAFNAADVPKLYIRAAYQIAHPAGRATGQLFWETNSSGLSEARSIKFPLITDAQFHTYELNLAASNSYAGIITQLRFDPAYNGEPGDYADIKAISASSFAGNEVVNPTLNVALSNQNVTLSFQTTSATAAGFIGKNLLYDLETCSNLNIGAWEDVNGYTNLVGDGSSKTATLSPADIAQFYRLRVRLQ